jgi:hypothetical protein
MAASSSATASAATQVGAVTRVQGSCVGVSDGTTRTLDKDVPVHLAEVISTGDAARLEIGLDDGTTLTLGENARLVIDRFVYRPSESLDALAVSTRGAFRFVSGAFKTASSTVSVQTPVATLGVRGTDFWGGPIDGAYGVFLLEGAVSVTTNVGEVVLDDPGEGVNLEGIDVAPGPVTIWPEDKTARAFATVTFN